MQRPKQRIPTKEKDAEWIENCARYFSHVCIPAVDPRKTDILYRAANGEMDESDYLYVTNPYNTNIERHKRFPSRIRNFDIISTDVMLLMGEKRRRGLNFTVNAINSNIEDIRKDLLQQMASQFLTEKFVQEVVSQQQQSGTALNPQLLQQDQQMSADEVKKKVNSLQDQIAIMGQATLDYIVDYNNFTSRCAENWYHFVCTGRAFSYRTVFKDEVLFEPVSPKEMKYLSNSRIRDIEDAESTIRYVRMPFNEVCDKFGELEGFDKIIPQLEARQGYGSSAENPKMLGSQMTGQDIQAIRASSALWHRIRGGEERVYSDEMGFLVEHVVWESQVKIGKLKSNNIFGEPFEMEVDEDFKPQAGETVEWVWCPLKWQAWIIDDRWVVGGEPLYVTQGSVDGYRKSKGPYNGKILNMRHVNPLSIVEKGLNYQIKYNIIHYYIEKCFAKNLDKIIVMPIGLIPESKDLTMEASMYYANAMGFLWVDESNKNFLTALNGIKVLDASLSQHINALYEYLKIIKDEWDASIGITPQRKGQMQASDGKATTENSTFRSSIMTEEYFTQFEEFEEVDLQYMIELSKIAFVEGKKGIFVKGTNLDKGFLDIDPEPFCYADYLIRVKNSGRALEQLEMAKAQAQALTQNKDGKFSDVLKVIRADNISELIEEMENVEAAFDAQQQQAAQAQQQHEQTLEQMKQDGLDKTYNAAIYKADKTYDGVTEAARITADAKLIVAPNGEADIAQLDKNSVEREKIASKKEEAQLKAKTEMDKAQLDKETSNYKVDKDVEIAKAQMYNRRYPTK